MKRRVMIVTEATHAACVRALGYVIEMAGCADYDGDHDESSARSFERALGAIKDAPTIDTDALVKELQWAIDEVRCYRDSEYRARAERLHERFQRYLGRV